MVGSNGMSSGGRVVERWQAGDGANARTGANGEPRCAEPVGARNGRHMREAGRHTASTMAGNQKTW